MNMRSFTPKPEHDTLMKDLKEALAKYPEMPNQEVLAITSQLVGHLVAVQDQSLMTVDMALDLVSMNIEVGNRAVVLELERPQGSS
jgi:hypothetical protein